MFKKLLLILLVFNSSALAQDESPEDLLKEVTLKLDKIEGELIGLKKSQVATNLSLDNNIKETREISNGLKSIEAKIIEIQKNKITFTEQLEEVTTRLKSSRNIAERRLRALYKAFHRAVIFEMILNSKDPLDLIRRYKYLNSINDYDFKNLSSIKSLAVELIKKKKDLDQINKDLEEEKIELGQKNERLAMSQKIYVDLITNQKTAIDAKQQKLTLLNQSKERLEALLNGVMGGKVTTTTDTFISDKPFAKLIGKFSRPVNGEVIFNYGNHHLEDIDDDIFVKGDEYKTRIGERIMVISDGQVILQQNLPGLGMVIIVDHGTRFYTLYGRLASALVSKGDTVKAGSTIGITGEVDTRGRNFYFEYRNKGKAEDPKVLWNTGGLKAANK